MTGINTAQISLSFLNSARPSEPLAYVSPTKDLSANYMATDMQQAISPGAHVGGRTHQCKLPHICRVWSHGSSNGTVPGIDGIGGLPRGTIISSVWPRTRWYYCTTIFVIIKNAWKEFTIALKIEIPEQVINRESKGEREEKNEIVDNGRLAKSGTDN